MKLCQHIGYNKELQCSLLSCTMMTLQNCYVLSVMNCTMINNQLLHSTAQSCKYAITSTGKSRICTFFDGAESQFKNRYTLSNIIWPEKLNCHLRSIDWSFFGTAHGKGSVDGVGGTMKRAVWRRILNRGDCQ